MSLDSPQEKTLSEVLDAYQISLPADKIAQLENYCRELWTWNQKLNLTRHTDYEKFVTRDLIDALHLADHLQKGEAVLDVGTGGGVPGVLLAILRPDLSVELCDSTGKKVIAVQEILDAIGLTIPIYHKKAEELLKKRRYHTLVIRAVSKMDKLLTMLSASWFSFDRLLLIKGPKWTEERGESRHLGLMTNLALRKIDEYVTPGEDEHTSVILQICQKKRFAEINLRAEALAAGEAIEKVVGFVDRESEEKGKRFFRRENGNGRPRRDGKSRFGGDGRRRSEAKGEGRPYSNGRTARPGGSRPSHGGSSVSERRNGSRTGGSSAPRSRSSRPKSGAPRRSRPQ